jgi:hypothetical protein
MYNRSTSPRKNSPTKGVAKQVGRDATSGQKRTVVRKTAGTKKKQRRDDNGLDELESETSELESELDLEKDNNNESTQMGRKFTKLMNKLREELVRIIKEKEKR